MADSLNQSSRPPVSGSTSELTGLGIQDRQKLFVLAEAIEIRILTGLGPVGRPRRHGLAQRLQGGGAVPRPGGGGGHAVKDVLVAGMDLGRLAQELEGLFVLAPVVQ